MSLIDTTETNKQSRYPVLVFQNNPAQWLLIRLAMEQCFPEIEPILKSKLIEASAYLDSVSVLPRLIFIDFSLSSQDDGLAFLIQLKADLRLKKIPVIIISDSVTPEEVFFSYTLGAAGHVPKPFDYAGWLICFSEFKQTWCELANITIYR